MKRIIFFLFINILLLSFHSKAQVTLFSEDWSSGSLTTNGWTFSPNQLTNWKDSTAYIPTGATSPCALFFWAPQISTSYTNSLVSPIIQSVNYSNLTLSYKIHYEKFIGNIPNPTQEEFKVEYKSVGSSTWTTLITYDNNNSTSSNYNFTVTNQPLTGVTGNIQVRFRVNGDNTFNIQGWTVDDIVVKGTLLPACSGSPSVTIASNTYNYCATSSTNPILTATPGSSNSGFTFQWQSRPACSASSFTDISGATSANYIVTSLSSATDYRVKITCAGSNQSAFSNFVNIYQACYCQSEAQNSSGADIGYVYINGFTAFSNPAATSVYINNSAANRQYTDFSYLTPLQITPGSPPAYYITQINSTATQTSAYLKAFIDFNRNGVFTDAGEQVNVGASSAAGTPTSPVSISGTFTIPTSVTPGYTKMRLVLVEGGNATTVNSCINNYSKGETEDYTVLIRPSTSQTVTASNSGPICLSTASNIQLNANISAGFGCPFYSWTGPNGFTSNAQNPTINNPTASNLGTYSVTVSTYGNNYTVSSSTTVSQVTTPIITNITPQNPTSCSSSNGSLILTGLLTNTSYTVNYQLNGNPVTVTLTSNSSGNIIISNLGVGTYSNINVSLGGCASISVGPYTLTGQLTTPPTATNSGSTCAGSSFTLFASTIANATYSWTGPNGFISNQQNPTITNSTISNSGTYSVIATINGCNSLPATTSITINPMPSTPTITSNSPICEGTNLTLSTPNVTNGSFHWTGPNSLNSFSQNITISNLLPMTGTYYLTVSIGNCTSNAASVNVVVNPVPTAPQVSSNSPLCSGNTLNLTAVTNYSNATFSWTGPGGFISTQQNPVITNPISSNSGIYNASVIVNGCSSTNSSTSVTVTNIPVISAVSITNPTGCGYNNGSFTVQGLLPNTQYIITFSRFSVAQLPDTATSNSSGQITVSNLNAGFYNNIIAILNGCPSLSFPSGVTLVNPNTPAKPTINTNAPICVGSTLTLSTPFLANATYNWSGPNYTSNQQNPSIPNAQSINSGIYILTVTVNNCTSIPDTVNIMITPTPATPSISSNSPVCVGSSININASSFPNVVYHWIGPNGFTSTSQNPTLNNASSSMAGNYTVYTSIGNCQSLHDSLTVIVNPVPAKPTVISDTFCQYTTIPALTAIGQNLLWYNTPTSTNGSSNPPIPNSNNIGTTTWYVTQSLLSCESAKQPIHVTIKPTPSAPGVVTPILYCQYNTPVVLTATGQNLLWYTISTGGTGTPTAPMPNTNILGTTTYYVSQSLNGCESNRSLISYTVLAKPDTPKVSNPFQFCVGQTNATISAQGNQLKWYTSPTSINGSTNPPTINTSLAGTTIYYVSQTAGNNCESDRSKVVVIVHENVKANVSVSAQLICQYDTILVANIATTPPNPATSNYHWNFDGGVVISGTGAGPYQIRWDTAGHKTINVSIDNFNCVDNDDDTVFVKPSPLGEFVLKKDACINEIMYVQAAWNSMNATDYYWDFTDAQIMNSATGPGAYKIRFNNAGDHYITLKTHINGCYSWPNKDTIHIHDFPTAKIEPINTNICLGDSLFLKMQGSTYPNYAYIWSPAFFYSVNGLPEVTALIREAGYVKLNVVDPYGCTGSDSVFVNAAVCCSVTLPNAFTPNGDGKNDVFRIISNGHQQVSIFRVVNRWGQTIWETANGNEGWDGTLNGAEQDMGTYYYFLRYKCYNEQEFHDVKGEIILVR